MVRLVSVIAKGSRCVVQIVLLRVDRVLVSHVNDSYMPFATYTLLVQEGSYSATFVTIGVPQGASASVYVRTRELMLYRRARHIGSQIGAVTR